MFAIDPVNFLDNSVVAHCKQDGSGLESPEPFVVATTLFSIVFGYVPCLAASHCVTVIPLKSEEGRGRERKERGRGERQRRLGAFVFFYWGKFLDVDLGVWWIDSLQNFVWRDPFSGKLWLAMTDSWAFQLRACKLSSCLCSAGEMGDCTSKEEVQQRLAAQEDAVRPALGIRW